jgi:hypothetical protein
MAVPVLQYLPGGFHFKVQCLLSGEVEEGLSSAGLAGDSRLILEWKDIDKRQYFANVPISPAPSCIPIEPGLAEFTYRSYKHP